MTSLLVYGSLMHPQQLDEHIGAELPRMPVRVRGFRRSFTQEPSWRTGQGEKRGVLTVRPSPLHWFNAILICGCEAPTMTLLDERERGYVRHPVPSSDIRPYAGALPAAAADECSVYVGRDELRNDRLLPNSDYMRLCLEAAEQWGTRFHYDFLVTTFIGPASLQEA